MVPFSTMRQQAEILGVNVDAIVFRQGQAGFEFSRQINLAVDRLLRSACARAAGDRLAIEPDFMIGAGARGQVPGQRSGRLLQFVADAIVAQRRRAGHDVAFHVAACAQRGQQGRIDAGDGVFQVALEDAVKLDALPAGETQGAVGVLRRPAHRGPGIGRPSRGRPGSCSGP